MSEIIDILTFNDDYTAEFTVNHAVLYVSLANGPAGNGILQNALNKTHMQRADNFQVLTAGIVMPEGFMLSGGIRSTTLQFRNFFFLTLRNRTDTAQYDLTEIGGGSSRLYMPMENYEMAVDVFVNVADRTGNVLVPPPATKQLDEDFKFRLVLNNFYVSMVNVPAAFLNGTKQLVFPFVKILHNLPMIS